jgi:hypothetical protein
VGAYRDHVAISILGLILKATLANFVASGNVEYIRPPEENVPEELSNVNWKFDGETEETKLN